MSDKTPKNWGEPIPYPDAAKDPFNAVMTTPSETRAGKLPELPEPVWIAVDTPGADLDVSFFQTEGEAIDYLDGVDPFSYKKLYTADQMRAYALEALAASEPVEAVAWRYRFPTHDKWYYADRKPDLSGSPKRWGDPVIEKLYTHPAPEQPGKGERELTQDERAAVEFYTSNPTAAHQDLRRRLAPQPSDPAEGDALTFAAFRKANVARCERWHPDGIESWSPSDWLTAVTGELGELASLLKMRNRERDALPGNKFSPTNKQIADECADVITYMDLLATVLGIDLGRAVAEKFNEVSERVGFPERIALSTPPTAAVSVDDGREQFEIYATNMGCHDFEEIQEDGYRGYCNPNVESKWNYWRASRAALTAALDPQVKK